LKEPKVSINGVLVINDYQWSPIWGGKRNQWNIPLMQHGMNDNIKETNVIPMVWA